MTLGYRVGASVMAALTRALARWQVINEAAVPKEGPLIVVANHVSFVDPPLLAASIPRPMVFLAKEEAFRSLPARAFFGAMGVIPIRRGQPGREVLAKARQVLEDGGALAIFPEGTRSKKAELGWGHSGCVLLALWTGAPILPVGITGTEGIKGPGSLFSVLMASVLRSARPTFTFNIGHTFYLPRVEGPVVRDQRIALTRLIMEHIARLLPPSYRGVYGRAGEVLEEVTAATLGN